MKKIKLNNTENEYALVDDEDHEYLSKHTWTKVEVKNTFYADNKKIGMMHRYLLLPEDGQIVDHKNHDGLDNQKHNLRIVTHSQNKINSQKLSKLTSDFKGVHQDSSGSWVAQITNSVEELERKYLGIFPSQEIASTIYNFKARELFGEYASLNTLDLSDTEQLEVIEKWKNGEYLPKKSSKYEGVSYLKREKCYLAYIHENKMQFPMGYYTDEDEAGQSVSKYYDSKLDSYAMKTKALHFWRFVRKYYLCATEVGQYNADVLCSDGTSIIETEIKISEQDLKKEFEKEKHLKYLSKHVSRCHEVPNKYYLMVPKKLKDLALELIQDKPYGLLIVDGRQVSNKRKKTFTEVVKPATNLTYKYCDKLHRKIILRMSSELVQGHIKLLLEKENK